METQLEQIREFDKNLHDLIEKWESRKPKPVTGDEIEILSKLYMAKDF